MTAGINATAPNRVSARRPTLACRSPAAARYATASSVTPLAMTVYSRKKRGPSLATIHSLQSQAGTNTATHRTCGQSRNR